MQKSKKSKNNMLEATLVHAKASRNATKNGELIVLHDQGLLPTAKENWSDGDERGDFVMKRVFSIHNVDDVSAVRGQHGHMNVRQILIAIHGEITVTAEHKDSFQSFRLTSPTQCVCIPPGNWIEMKEFSPDAVLLVFCDEHFENDIVVADKDAFMQ